MNFLRGLLSIGIIIACLLNWVDVETEHMMFSFSGLAWVPTTILLYASVLTAGYAFYNSYRSSNRNAWIYLTCGLYGSGVSFYIYLSVTQNVSMIYEFVSARQTDSLLFSFGVGIYLTGLFSFLLFLSGFDKSDNSASLKQFDKSDGSMGQLTNLQGKAQERPDKPNLRDWMKENPGKSINDYYSKFK